MKYFLVLFAALFITACAHHRDVRAGVDGVHRVVVLSEDDDKGQQEAISQANHYCKEKGKEPAFISEDKKYTGSMKEDEYKKGKTVAKVAQGIGSAAWIFGGKNESAVGGVAAIGGGVADSALGKGYTVEMKFKCQ